MSLAADAPGGAEARCEAAPFHGKGRETRGDFLDEVLAWLTASCGVDLSGYRRATLRQRLKARMEQTGFASPDEYLTRLHAEPGECDELIGLLTVSVTSFFRNPIVFEILAQRVLPEIVARKARRGSRELRVWCAGCATGEEPYSVAILIHRALRRAPGTWTPLLFATDLNEEALGEARLGVYPRSKFESTQLGILDQYFIARGDRFEVNPEIRSLVRFSRDDLTQTQRLAPADSVFGAFDLVLFRNVAIYFSPSLQNEVFQKLHRSLDREGYLVLGEAEFLPPGVTGGFRALDARNRIFRKS